MAYSYRSEPMQEHLKALVEKKAADGKERDKALETTADFEISETMESVLELPEKQRNAVYLFIMRDILRRR